MMNFWEAKAPRAVWLMGAAAVVVSDAGATRAAHARGDTTILRCGNSYYIDVWCKVRDPRTGPCGNQRGVWGLERGYCLIIGGETTWHQILRSESQTLAAQSTARGC